MNARSVLAAAAVAVAITVTASPAHAATLESFQRSAFDGTPVVSAAGYVMAGPTSGELGGHLQLSVKAADDTVPEAGQCETATVQAVLTVADRETFTIDTSGELCTLRDGSPRLNAYFGDKQTTYTGTHKRAKIAGDGLIAFSNSWFGAQGSVALSVRW